MVATQECCSNTVGHINSVRANSRQGNFIYKPKILCLFVKEDVESCAAFVAAYRLVETLHT